MKKKLFSTLIFVMIIMMTLSSCNDRLPTYIEGEVTKEGDRPSAEADDSIPEGSVSVEIEAPVTEAPAPDSTEKPETTVLVTEKPVDTAPATTAKPETTVPVTEKPVDITPATTAKPETTVPVTEKPVDTAPATTAKPETTVPVTEKPVDTTPVTTEKPETTAPEPLPSNLIDRGTWGEMTWTLDKNGTLTVTGSGPMKDGDTSGPYVSTYILPKWCDYLFEVTSIVLDDRITVIGHANFQQLIFVKSIHLPSSLVEIRSKAFSRCGMGDSIVFPDGLKYIGERAFEYYKCEELDLPASVTTVGNYAFQSAGKLKALDLSHVTSLGKGAFNNCQYLESVTLSPELEHISESLFDGCYALSDISIPDSVKTIGNKAFAFCPSISRMVFGENSRLEKIGNDALPHLLKVVNIPKNVTSIGEGNFKQIYEVLNRSSLSISLDSEVKYAHVITDPADSRVSYENGFIFFTTPEGEGLIIGCELDDKIITIPNQYTFKGQLITVDRIPKYGISGLPHLEKAVLPDAAKKIDQLGFFQCPSLSSYIWPSTQFALDDLDFPYWYSVYYSDFNHLNMKTLPITNHNGKEFYILIGKGSCGEESIYKVYGYTAFLRPIVLYIEGPGKVSQISGIQTIETVVISPDVTELGYACISNFTRVDVVFNGTPEQWEKINTSQHWGGYNKPFRCDPDFFM